MLTEDLMDKIRYQQARAAALRSKKVFRVAGKYADNSLWYRLEVAAVKVALDWRRVVYKNLPLCPSV